MSDNETIFRTEYERLIAAGEELAEFRAALAVVARIASGDDELAPALVADWPIAGEPPLHIWREHPGLSQAAMSRAAKVNRVQIVEIEAGRNTGSAYTLRKLVDALGISVDDLIPGVTGWSQAARTCSGEICLAPFRPPCPVLY